MEFIDAKDVPCDTGCAIKVIGHASVMLCVTVDNTIYLNGFLNESVTVNYNCYICY